MNLIDKLLSVDKEGLTKECTKTYHSKNMERLTGDGEITLRKVKERKLRERALNTLDKKGNLLLVNAHDSDLLVLMDGVKEPNLKDERLLEHFGAATPKDLAELLFDGEIQEISDAINNFYKDQEDEATENDVKN